MLLCGAIRIKKTSHNNPTHGTEPAVAHRPQAALDYLTCVHAPVLPFIGGGSPSSPTAAAYMLPQQWEPEVGRDATSQPCMTKFYTQSHLLSKTPKGYALTIRPDLDAARFNGKAIITLKATAQTRVLTLHAADLTLQSRRGTSHARVLP